MFFVITCLYFVLQNYMPGGPVQDALARIQGMGGAGGVGFQTEADIDLLRQDLERQYGLDKPVFIRYFIWLKNILLLDFGESIATRQPAIHQIYERLPVSLSFGVPGFFLMYLVCIPLGIMMALKDGKRFDIISSFVLFVLYSIPTLVLALLFLYVFCTDRVLPMGAIFPLGGLYSDNFEEFSYFGKLVDLSKHLFLPILASIIGNFTILSLLQKNTMLDVVRSDYIRTARAKGLFEKVVIFKHALRNALIPIMVGFGGILSTFLGGSIIIEQIFGIPGIGLLTLQSLEARDFNVVMALVVLQSFAIMFGQLLSDMIYGLVDPRIRFH